jgi:glycosyltransferase involved in cell wall biosynthesis
VTVIPSIGRERLGAAVRSALGQTIRNHHVVVVSDGSPLPALPDDPRLTVVNLRRHYGVAALPRNVGVRVSDSEFVAFLDDDNTWTPDHLQRLVPPLVRGADLAYGGLQWVDADGEPLGTLSVPFDRGRLRDENFVDTNAMVLRRTRGTRFRVVPRRRGDATFEDWELAWRTSRWGNVVHVDVTTALVLVHDGSQFSVPRPDQVPASRFAAAGQ